jgi:hypothetical protein
VIAAPPSEAGALKLSVALALPAVAVPIVGAPGTVSVLLVDGDPLLPPPPLQPTSKAPSRMAEKPWRIQRPLVIRRSFPRLTVSFIDMSLERYYIESDEMDTAKRIRRDDPIGRMDSHFRHSGDYWRPSGDAVLSDLQGVSQIYVIHDVRNIPDRECLCRGR